MLVLPLATMLGAATAVELMTAPLRPKLVDIAFLGWSLANRGKRWPPPWRVHWQVPGGRCRLHLSPRARLLGRPKTTDDRRDCCGRRGFRQRRPQRREQLVFGLLRERRSIPIGWVGREAHGMQTREHPPRLRRTCGNNGSNVKLEVLLYYPRALTASAQPRTRLSRS